MQKIPAVENAKALMKEATTWSVMKWLREKKRVRKTADEANAALDEMNLAVKKLWTAQLKAAYQELAGSKRASEPVNRETALQAKKIKEADDEAYRARMDAEATFDTAEKRLSTSLAREGCRKAIHSWELHEKAIRKAESGDGAGALLVK